MHIFFTICICNKKKIHCILKYISFKNITDECFIPCNRKIIKSHLITFFFLNVKYKLF